MATPCCARGARGWRRWSTLLRHAGHDFSPIAVEGELLKRLVREAGASSLRTGSANGRFRPNRFRVDESVWPWLDIVDTEVLRAELEAELTLAPLQAALADGPPQGMD